MSEETARPSQFAGRGRDGLDSGLTEVVCADFERLIASHHKTDFLGLLMLEQTDVARTTFLPFRGVGRKPEEFRPPMGRSWASTQVT